MCEKVLVFPLVTSELTLQVSKLGYKKQEIQVEKCIHCGFDGPEICVEINVLLLLLIIITQSH